MYAIHDVDPQFAANRRYWCGWAGTSPDGDLHTGRRIATLQASAVGEPVYSNIGFETVAEYRLFKLP
ncbi:MAG TPA: hypothetical protein VL738_31645 [Dactylosporangium sp.]|jgi:hypothetical protein|nr:hypothetical protein [Dactylosporangium sp.]